jgi:quinol monooxygenase YgiN
MLVRIVKLSIDAQQLNQFMICFNEAKKSIRNFEGCTELKLFHDMNEKNVLFTYSHWQSEMHLRNYVSSELFSKTWKQVKPLFCAKAEAWSLMEI